MKSKTKGMIFSNKEIDWSTEPVVLCGNKLPWVSEAKYLGNTVTNIVNGMSKDISVKRASFIERNCELIQEFGYAHPAVQCKINQIFNS